MRAAALAATVAGLAPLPAAAADSPPAPPYIGLARWVSDTLRVFPTPSGRALAGELGKPRSAAEQAWREVLTLAPGADTPGMRAQFVCHWQFAEFAEPGKYSWDLEPWRPVVDENAMVLAGCNPGGPEIGF